MVILFFLVFISAFSFLSCATVSKVDTVFETPEAVQPQWDTFAAGVDFFHSKTSKPRLEFWALRLDLSSPNVHVTVKGGAGDGLSAKVSSFVRDNGFIAGINAAPFDVSSSKEGQPIQNVGIIVSGGKLISPANPRYDALVISKDRRAVIVSQSSIYSIANIESAAGGFHQILAEGKPAQRTQDRSGRHPRSAAGVSANGRYLYLLVIDGSRSGSIGATEEETALLLRALGSVDGINLDGGGSSALALRYPDGKVKVVNNPAHNRIPGTERAVASCIGIIGN